MNASQIEIGTRYEIKIGKNATPVRVASFDEPHGTWLCETENGKTLRIKEPNRFLKKIVEKKSLREIIDQRSDAGPRSPSASSGPLHVVPLDDTSAQRKQVSATERKCQSDSLLQPPTPARGPKPAGVMSVLAAAHRVLQEAGKPMKICEIMEAALSKGYCVVGGKTPFNTFNGGIRMEITKKGKESRFKWVGKGLFDAR